MAEEQHERNLPATPRRREEAREKGDVAKSREMISAALILGAALWLYAMGQTSAMQLVKMSAASWSSILVSPITQHGIYDLMVNTLTNTLGLLLPVAVFFSAVAIFFSLGQHGFLWTGKGLTPDWSRINPGEGLGRLFSIPSLFEFAKTLVKFLVIGFVVYNVTEAELPAAVVSIQLAPDAMLPEMARIIVRLLFLTGLIVAVIGAADYGFQYWEHEKKLRMTRQEMKEEMRQTEGDPLIRSRIRAIQKEMAHKRMMAEVPKAAVVITNPTHLAIALQYNAEEMTAPRLVAKGAGLMAQRIRDVARNHGIPQVENKIVARALFKEVALGDSIPSNLYRAVAEILVYVYQFRKVQNG